MAFAILFLQWIAVRAAAPTYSNPVIAGDYPDPSVIRVNNDYWATATTSEWAPLFPILHSTDLVNWKPVGSVFHKRPGWAVGNFWAPEISEFRGKFFVYYVGRQRNGPLAVAVATADQPQGPWTDHGPMIAQEAGSIDPVTAVDESGRRFLIWKEDGNSRDRPTPIWAQELSADGTKLVGEMKELMRNDQPWEGNLVEGPFVQRRGDFFYMFYSGNACCGRGCNYGLGVARARSLMGPWEKYSRNPILIGNERFKCPGHGSVVTDPKGRDFLMYHSYDARNFVYVGRQALLDEIEWQADGWPHINSGRGPSSSRPAPLGQAGRNTERSFDDDFSAPKLDPNLQWPQGNEPVVQLLAENRGTLLLSPRPERAGDWLGAVLGLKTTSGDYEASTALDVRSLGPGTHAGISAYGDSENALGVSVSNGKVSLWKVQKKQRQSVTEIDAPTGSRLFFRLTASQGHRFRCAISADGLAWKDVGRDLDLEGDFLPPWDRGVRVALVCGGPAGSGAKFEFLRLNPSSE